MPDPIDVTPVDAPEPNCPLKTIEVPGLGPLGRATWPLHVLLGIALGVALFGLAVGLLSLFGAI